MKYWTFFLIVISFGACQDIKQPEKPKDLISKDKMINVLTEAYLANAARSVDNKSIIAEGIKMDSLFYTKFGVDSLQFAKSNAYYAANLDLYITIIKDVETRLDEMVKALDSTRDSRIKQKDSSRAKSIDRLPNLKPSDDI